MINVEDHLGLVHTIARKRHQQFGHKYSYDDLYQEGCIGLLKAIERFDKTKGVRFSTYAYACINSHILNMIRDDKWYGGNSEERFKSSGPYSLDVTIEIEGNKRELSYINLIEGNEFNFEKVELKILLDGFPEKIKEIIKMSLGGFTQTEIAKKIGCSKSNISTLKLKALKELKYQLG